eukprot:NODE_514_length_1654_cov_79.349533_g426_i0.p3 GENE.NODE_514_length_1654_cov_79.349533_g426_i0~~NODE_514_length_1654_cov_79.349533_g426_i0.p3  ORF type:complete len:93 (-),score=25.29 NODE_514_length_1654_cov_79.349533_g426_i0:1330-1608(-)
MTAKLEPYTVPDDPSKIDTKLTQLKRTFKNNRTRDVSFRIKQLQAFKKALVEMRPNFNAALQADIGRSGCVNDLMEITGLIKKIDHAIENID